MKAAKYSRWVPLHTTSPSGKTLFVCLMCGDITPAPNAECAEPPAVGVSGCLALPCSVLEEIQKALIENGESEDVTAGRSQLYVSKNSVTWIDRNQYSVVAARIDPELVKDSDDPKPRG